MGLTSEFHFPSKPREYMPKSEGIKEEESCIPTTGRYLGPDWAKRFLGWSDENKVRTGPERRGNAAAGPSRKDDIVVIRRLETLDHGWQRLGLGHRQMGEKAVNVGFSAVALGNEGNLRILARKVPTQRGC